MAKLVLPGKAYVVFWGQRPDLETRLSLFGARLGFRLVKSDSLESLKGLLGKIDSLVAVICDEKHLPVVTPLAIERLVTYGASTHVAQVLEQLEGLIGADLHPNLRSQFENDVKSVVPLLLGSEFKVFYKESGSAAQFTHFVACELQADGFKGRAVCEYDPPLGAEYPTLKSRSEGDLDDLMGEVCNQILGALSASLRAIGLSPLISLPFSGRIHDVNNASLFVDYLPAVRLIDSKKLICFGVGAKIDPECKASWQDLSPTIEARKIEYL